MRIAGHRGAPATQRHVHPALEGMERAFERLQELNATKFKEGTEEIGVVGAAGARFPANVRIAHTGP